MPALVRDRTRSPAAAAATVEVGRAELVALRVDARSDDAAELGGSPIASTVARDRAGDEAAPTDVCDADHAVGADERNRRAVGDLHRERGSRNRGHSRVRLDAGTLAGLGDPDDRSRRAPGASTSREGRRPCAAGPRGPAGIELIARSPSATEVATM